MLGTLSDQTGTVYVCQCGFRAPEIHQNVCQTLSNNSLFGADEVDDDRYVDEFKDTWKCTEITVGSGAEASATSKDEFEAEVQTDGKEQR